MFAAPFGRGSTNWREAGRIAIVTLLAFLPANAQLPASAKLSDQDEKAFREEVARVEGMLSVSSDQLTVAYNLARTWASAKQWPQTIELLRKIASSGIDPSRDKLFDDLRGTAEFTAILNTVREATAPVANSVAAFEISEGDLAPESVAYDSKRFYFGSMRKGKVLRCSEKGVCETFVEGLGEVLGLKARHDGLWVLSNTEQESALLHYDLSHGTVLGKFAITGPGHAFNDLAFTAQGDVYFTDTVAGVVWHLAPGASSLRQLRANFTFANGIALSPDDRLLYVSSYGDGISVMDLKTRKVMPIGHPADLCLGAIDGLYFHRGTLIAIQNGFVAPRVVRLKLSKDLKTVEQWDVLERGNPRFEGVTTGVVVGSEFFYMANIQDQKKTEYKPIAVLKLRM